MTHPTVRGSVPDLSVWPGVRAKSVGETSTRLGEKGSPTAVRYRRDRECMVPSCLDGGPERRLPVPSAWRCARARYEV